MIEINIKPNSLIVVVGVSGSGKSTFCKKYFSKSSIVSSDDCRRLLAFGDKEYDISDDEIQCYSKEAFELLYCLVRGRLKHKLLTIIDATNINSKSRNKLEEIAASEGFSVEYIVIDTSLEQCLKNNSGRKHPVKEDVVRKQYNNFISQKQILKIKTNNFLLFENLDNIKINFLDLNKKINFKKIDVIGDIHGCLEELKNLLIILGYKEDPNGYYIHEENRIFLITGDFVDRGPSSIETLFFIKKHCDRNLALTVIGNHEWKFQRYLMGRNIKMNEILEKTIGEIKKEDDKKEILSFLSSLPVYLIYEANNKKYIIVHAAFKSNFINLYDKNIFDYCVYGPTENGKTKDGFPIRIPWWEDYDGNECILYGHLVTDDYKPRIFPNSIGLDTGCVFGGNLTAFRLPEEKFFSIKCNKYFDNWNE